MKNFKSILLSMLAGTMVCACASDPLIDTDQKLKEDDGEGVYMALDIQMPTGNLTRSETNDEGGSTGGTEIGSNEENAVTTALVVLAAKYPIGSKIGENGFIVASEIQSNRINELTVSEQTTPSKQYRARARLQKSNLNEFYGEYVAANLTGQPEVNVFVFVNPTKDLADYFANADMGDTKWLNMEGEVIQSQEGTPNQNIGIWGSNSFLMNNKSICSRSLPANLLDWEQYNSYDNAFHLSAMNEGSNVDNLTNRGPINVERSVARFDFKDGSGNKNTYNVLYAYKTDGTVNESAPIVNVQLQKMCLVNMSKKFYYLPRVSNNGLLPANLTDIEFCKPEIPWERVNGDWQSGNYVVGPNASVFSGTVTSGFSTYFNFPFFEDDGAFNNEEMSADRWDVVKIEDVLKGRDDNYVGKDNTEDKEGVTHAAGDYKVWRYVTENTIPGVEEQRFGVSTGVVFKGKLTGGFIEGQDYNEQAWETGSAKNLSACLDGGTYTYNGVSINGLKGNSQEDPILYYFNGKLYMGWRNIRQAAIQEAVTTAVDGKLEINTSGSLYKAVFGAGPIAPTYKIVYYEGGVLKEDTKKTVYYDSKTGTYKDLVDPKWDDKTSPENADYKASADYAWQQWNSEGKDSGGA